MRRSLRFAWTFSFFVVAILNWIFSNQLDFHLIMNIMQYVPARMVASQLNHQIILLLKLPLVHYWTSPLSTIALANFVMFYLSRTYLEKQIYPKPRFFLTFFYVLLQMVIYPFEYSFDYCPYKFMFVLFKKNEICAILFFYPGRAEAEF